jgi:putative Ca2+/H+ antiporter (TMEM165/GDT1 family)
MDYSEIVAAVLQIRDSGQINMLDRKGVAYLVFHQISKEVGFWLHETTPENYMRVLEMVGEEVHKRESSHDGE